MRLLSLSALEFERQLQEALKLDWPYSERPFRSREELPGLAAAVLVLFGWHEGTPSILLTRRTEKVERHKGQISFPGGVIDPEDESPVRAALRETDEEVGISPSLIRVVGELPEVWTITGFWITPIVGVLTVGLQETSLKLNPHETAEAIWAPLPTLLAPETYRREAYPLGERDYPIHVFQVGPHRVWGATGAMLKNLLDRLASLG